MHTDAMAEAAHRGDLRAYAEAELAYCEALARSLEKPPRPTHSFTVFHGDGTWTRTVWYRDAKPDDPLSGWTEYGPEPRAYTLGG